MSRTREKRSTKKTSTGKKSTIEIPRTPLPKNVPKTVNPKLEKVKYRQPKKPKGKGKYPKHRHAK